MEQSGKVLLTHEATTFMNNDLERETRRHDTTY
eukprot:COSAG02_NODE_49712_length_325_cov_0.685841_1_plen_32_part_10